MKPIVFVLSVTVGLAICVSLAFANPAMLPKHPGYPIGNPTDPVNNQPLANDTGQTNWFGERAAIAAAGFHDKESQQSLAPNLNDERLLKKQAGQLPKVEGPEFFSEPPVKEATRMK